MKGPTRKSLRESAIAYSLLWPNLLLFLCFSLFPVIWMLKYMFFKYGGIGTTEVFTGLENLKRVFRDGIYWQSVANTFIYALGKIIVTLFNVYNGEINRMLMAIGLISQPINWLGADHALHTLIIVAIWGALGNYMVYFLAGLQQIPQEVIESAEVDGATGFKKLWYITIPMMGPILKIILMLAIATAFNDMNMILVLTEGGPYNASMVMTLYAYKFFFPVSAANTVIPQFGYGAALSFVSAIIAGLVTVIFLKFSKKMSDIY